jgi:hypothetical protein
MANIVFENETAQALYNFANSNKFAKLELLNDMRDHALPFIKAVVEDQSAYEEANSKWQEFRTVKEHLENQKLTFEKLDIETSMCASLWFYIYH